MNFAILLMFIPAAILADAEPSSGQAHRYWPPTQRAPQQMMERDLNSVPSAKSLRFYHEMIAREPHYAGTAGDWKAAETLAVEFEKLGLEVERQEIWVYLCKPVSAELEIMQPTPVKLSVHENRVTGDEFSKRADLALGWNAYSGSGTATAEVVYANYGTREDFERLQKLGVDVRGKIVMAKYGGNYRGFKAKFAEQFGAAGLIIYTDPADSGYVQGLMYPEGGWANPSYIQRGSILTLDYSGDPLTPFIPATRDAKRLDPADVRLAKIPVQPVGWAAAGQILSRMDGPVVPREWQGGLPFTYRLSGDVVVRMTVIQERQVQKTYNIVGTLRGEEWPEQEIIVGCHHDAWIYGAGDPLAGTMIVYECAKSFSELARRGQRPQRTIKFANWGAEEFGLIGSVEWVESRREDLQNNAVAYLNLDMATMGPHFGASAAPLLKTLIFEVTRDIQPVQQGSVASVTSVFDQWVEKDADDILPGHPRFGHLGGGSDHVGFYCHAGVPSASLSVGGCDGVSYHSLYDNLTWYHKIVGDDYEPAKMLTRVVNLTVSRLANAPLLPLDPLRYAADVRHHVESLSRRAESLEFQAPSPQLTRAATSLGVNAHRVMNRLFERIESDSLTPTQYERVSRLLMTLEREWLTPTGLPGRPWFRSLYAATDADSGYDAWMLPALRQAVEARDATLWHHAVQQVLNVMDRLEHILRTIDDTVN